MTRLPRLAERLLAWRLPATWREFVIGDLEEEFRSRHTASPVAASWWLWRQALRALVRPLPVTTNRLTHPPGDPLMRTLLGDIRYGFRVLRRTPSFTFAVVAVLALGIGASTAIFSIVNTVLLRPLPFAEPDRLVRLYHVPPAATFPGIPRFSVSPANFYDWQRRSHVFEGMAIYRFRQFVLSGGGAAESVTATAVGDGFFDIVRSRPALGRAFLAEEDTPAHGHVVILSDGFWRRHFGAAPDAVGRTLTLDGTAYEIVGVMPRRFSGKAWAATGQDLWVPLAYTSEQRAIRDNHNDQVIARLRPGVTVTQANAELESISKALEAEYPQANAGWGATAVPLREVIVGDVRLPLIILLAAVGLVLLIACANVGNLLFARALGRRKEIAVRSALGAGRGRVFRQLLVETLLLAGAGGALGLGLARAALSAGAPLLATQVPRADELTLDGHVVLFVVLVSILTGVLAGTAPALRAGRADLSDALKEGGRNDSAVGLRTRRALIACEVALSVVLLMGAGVMIRTLTELRSIDAGFQPDHVLTLRLSVAQGRYRTAAEYLDFVDRVLDRIRALPGVDAAGAIDDLPTQGGSVQPIVLEGHAEQLPKDQPTVQVRKISPGLLRALSIPVLRGRDVAAGDNNVMLVSRDAARLLWGDDDPVGRRASLPLESGSRMNRVIGIVGDVKQEDVTGPTNPTVYELTRDLEMGGGSFAVAIRTTVPPLSLSKAVTAAVQSLAAEQPVDDVQTMEAVVNQGVTSQRFSAVLLGLFAAVALALASVGIYSVLSYVVRGRRREIGIRTALGAGTPAVVRMVVMEGMTPALVGIGLGAAAALLSGRMLRSLVFGVSATDPATLAIVAGVLALVALLASLLPAYRASRLDPLTVLRG